MPQQINGCTELACVQRQYGIFCSGSIIASYCDVVDKNTGKKGENHLLIT